MHLTAKTEKSSWVATAISSLVCGAVLLVVSALVPAQPEASVLTSVGGGPELSRALTTFPLAPDTTAALVLSDGSMTLVVLGREPRTFRIAGGGPSSAAVAAYVPDFRGAGAGAIAVGDPAAAGTAGRVYLFYVDGSLDSIPDLTFEGDAPGELFGAAVAGVGDVDGDGFGDLVVGQPGHAAGTGSARLYRGGGTPETSPAATYQGGASGDLFGSAIAGGGDFNNDTRPDFAIGAPGAAHGAGLVEVFHGGVGIPGGSVESLDPATTSGYARRLHFGASLAAGELTGDAFGDLAVGAPGFANGGGRTTVFTGASGGLSAGPTTDGSQALHRHGGALAIADLSGDGIADLAIGAPGHNLGRGAVSVFYGGPAFDTTPDIEDGGAAIDDAFGFALAAGNVVPNTTVPQLLVGAPFADMSGTNSGALYLIAAPPAVAVQRGAIELEFEGVPLTDGGVLDPATRLRARLTEDAVLALDRSSAYLDDAPCAIRSTADARAIEISLPPQVEDGRHLLRVVLASGDASTTIERPVTTYRRFELIGVRISPSPTRGRADLLFTMTRAGAIRVEVFDAAGRRVLDSGQVAGLAGENRLEVAGLARLETGLYFYRVAASFRGQEATAHGRIPLIR